MSEIRSSKINISRVENLKKQEINILQPAVFELLFILNMVMPLIYSSGIRSDLTPANSVVIAVISSVIMAFPGIIVLNGLRKNVRRMQQVAAGMAVLLLIVGFIFRKTLKSASIIYINSVLVNQNAARGEIVTFFDPENRFMTGPLALLLSLIAICSVLVIWELFYVRLYIMVMLIATASFIASSTANGRVNPIAAVSLVIALCMLIIMGGADINRDAGLKKAAVSLIMCSVLIVIGAAIFAGTDPERLNNAKEAFIRIAERNRFGESDLTDGDFTDIKPRNLSESQALKLTGNIKKDTYLKGFVGSVYNGHGFEDLDRKQYEGDNLKMFQWLSMAGEDYIFSPVTELSYALENSVQTDTAQTENINVSNTGAFKKYLYVPYGVSRITTSDGSELISLYNKDLNVKNSLVAETTDYNFNMIDPQIADEALINNQLKEEWQDVRYLIENYSYFAQREQNYAAFVKRNYLDIPQELKEYFDRQGLRSESGIYNITWLIRAFLVSKITYNETPESSYSRNKDFIINLLENDNEGYGVHYAAAATMLYRYYGIPARYVEGFITNGGMEVKISDAHAWTEVYMDGIGWIPAEVTPGMYREDIMENMLAPVIGSEQDDSLAQDSGSSGGSAQKARSRNFVPLIIIIAAAIIIAIIYLRRVMVLKNRRKRIDSSNAVESITFMVRLIIKWAALKGITVREDLPMKDGQEMDLAFDIFAGEGYRVLTQAVNHSQYGGKGASDNDRKIVEIYLNNMAEKIYSSGKWFEKLKFRFVDVLI